MRTAIRRVRAGWIALTGTGAAPSVVLALLVIGTVFVCVATPRASLGFRTRALRQITATTSAQARSVTGEIDYTSLGIALGLVPAGPGSQISAGTLDAIAGELAGNLAASRLPLSPASARWAGLASGYSVVTGAGRTAYDGSTPPQAEVIYRSALGRFARLAAGRMPAADSVTPAGASFQVAVTGATAARFGLHVGSVLGIGSPTRLVVTGILRPVTPHSAFWTADPDAAAATFNKTAAGGFWLGAVFVGRPELADLETVLDTGDMLLYWNFPLGLSDLNANQASGLSTELTGAMLRDGVLTRTVSAPTSVALSSGLAGPLATFLQEEGQVGSLLSLLYVSLAIVGAVVLLLGSRLLAERRAAEFGLMRARGAAFWQLAGLALRAGAVVVLPAAAVGAALAAAATPGDDEPLAWWLAVLTLLVALISVPVLAVRRTPATGVASERADRPPTRTATARRWVTDLTLVAAAAGGLIVLKQQGPPAAGAIDLYTSAAPVLVAIPVAIVVVRVYPVLVRALVRLAGRRSGVTAFVGLARAARSSVLAVLPAFALVLALAVIAFGATLRTAVARGEVAASWQGTGADAVISGSASVRPFDTATQRAIAAVPGVERAAAISVLSGVAADGAPLAVVVVSPASYAALIADTPQPPFPAAALARPAGSGPATAAGPLPVLASPAAVALIGRGTKVLIGIRTVPVRVVGSITSTPGATQSSPTIVLPRWAAGAVVQSPNEMLVVGPQLDAGRLRAVLGRLLPGATVTFRADLLAGLAGAPLPRGAYLALADGAGAAAGFGVAILLIMAVLGARPRELTLARLATMGLSPGQSMWLVIAESLPSILAATAGGVISAWALVPLIGPNIDLSAFTGTGAAVPVRADFAALGYTAAGLLILALMVLFAQAAATRVRGAARALRVSE